MFNMGRKQIIVRTLGSVVVLLVLLYIVLVSRLSTPSAQFWRHSAHFTDSSENGLSPSGYTFGDNHYSDRIRTSLRGLVDVPFNFNVSGRMGYKHRHNILFLDGPRWFHLAPVNSCLSQCAYNNCHPTTDNTTLQSASALVFFYVMYRGKVRDLPVNSSARNPNQVWVFFSKEPPTRVNTGNLKSEIWLNQFNWSMNYRLDSDILSPYGFLRSRTSMTNKNYTAIFEQKNKMTVWIVSHCRTSSKREKYVNNLQSAGIDVDIFGACGTNTQRLPVKETNAVLARYKFYLSFENTFCTDYITEKLFTRYNQDLILIVRGGADYNKLIPTRTFINTSDYKSVSDLAKFMLSLANDEKAYINFLRRKDNYEAFGPWPVGYCYGYCELCEKVNNMDMYRKTYTNPENYIKSNQCVLPDDVK